MLPENKESKVPRDSDFPGVSDLVVIAGLLLLVLAALLPNLLDRSLPFNPLSGEYVSQWYAYYVFFNRCLDYQVMPLWTSNFLCGFPLVGFSHSSMFYPLYFRFLGLEPSIYGFMFAHIGLFTTGSYLFFRWSGFRLWVAATGGVMALLLVLNHSGWTPVLAETGLLPWLYLLCCAFLAKPDLIKWMLLSAVLCLMMFAGQIETMIYALLGLVAVIAVYHRQGLLRVNKERLFMVIVAGALALVLSSIQWLPMYEYLEHSIRAGGLTYDYYVSPDPGVTGPMKIFISYLDRLRDLSLIMGVGIVLALVKGPLRARTMWILAALLLMAINCIPDSPVRWFAFHLPVLGRLVRPGLGFCAIYMLMLIASVGGIARLMDSRGPRSAIIAGFVLGIFGAAENAVTGALFGMENYRLGLIVVSVLLIGLLVLWRARPDRASLVVKLILAVALVEPFILYQKNNPRVPIETLENIYPQSAIQGKDGRFTQLSNLGPYDPQLKNHLGIYNDTDELFSIITAPHRRLMELWAQLDPGVIVFREGRLHFYRGYTDSHKGRYLNARTYPFLCLVGLRYVYTRDRPFALAGLYPIEPYLRREMPRVHYWGPSEGLSRDIRLRDPISTYCWEQAPDDRLEATFECKEQKAPGKVRLTVLSSTDAGAMTNEEDFVLPGDSSAVSIRWRPRPHTGRRCFTFTVDPPDRDCSLRHPVLMRPSQPFKYLEGDDIMLFENKEALPRAFIVHKAFVVTDQKAKEFVAAAGRRELASMIAIAQMPRALQYLEGGGTKILYPAGSHQVDRVMRKPGLEIYKVETTSPGFLFESEIYYPGWKAYLDGQEQLLLRANHAFRAVFIPSGSHTVTLRFEPMTFRLGLWISMAGMGVWTVIISIGVFRRLYYPSSQEFE